MKKLQSKGQPRLFHSRLKKVQSKKCKRGINTVVEYKKYIYKYLNCIIYNIIKKIKREKKN